MFIEDSIHLVDAVQKTTALLQMEDLKTNKIVLIRTKPNSMLCQVEDGHLKQPKLDPVDKPLGYCWWEAQGLLEDRLDNHLFEKYPDSEEEFWYKQLKFVTGVIQMLISKQNICRELKSSHILFDDTVENYMAETPNKSMVKVSSMDSGGSTCLDISSDLPQSGETDMEIKKDEAHKVFKFFSQPSHLRNIWPNMKTGNKSQRNNYHLLLLTAALLSTVTLLTAVRILGCGLEESYKYNSLLNQFCLIVNQHPYIIRLVLTFNSIAFFLSTALMIILFSELSLRPLLLVSAFSMVGTYMCTIWTLRSLA